MQLVTPLKVHLLFSLLWLKSSDTTRGAPAASPGLQKEETFVLSCGHGVQKHQFPCSKCSSVPVFQARYALFASAAKCQSQSWGALFVGPFTFWLAIIVFLYLMLWIALQLNNGLWAVCSAPQRSSCLSTALADDLSDSDIKTVRSCFPRSFNSPFVCLLLTTQQTWEFRFGSRLCGC